MKYLLDVNALIALGFEPHEFHRRVVNWSAKNAPEIATCSITELGFVRVLSQVARYGLSVTEAQSLLLRLKASKAMTFRFVADDHDLSYMPSWVKSPDQTTDGHLLELARAKGGSLATLDRRIPGAFVIPESGRVSRSQIQLIELKKFLHNGLAASFHVRVGTKK